MKFIGSILRVTAQRSERITRHRVQLQSSLELGQVGFAGLEAGLARAGVLDDDGVFEDQGVHVGCEEASVRASFGVQTIGSRAHVEAGVDQDGGSL